MTKKFLAMYTIVGLLISTLLPLNVAALGPDIRLPTGFVTMRATNGIDSYFDMHLSGIPAGFDIANGTYAGWCIQSSTTMARNVNHTVLLFSSYDPEMPLAFINQNWDKVNYVINHKQGDLRSIQDVIWYYICNASYPANDTDAEAMIADANQNGIGFAPTTSQKIAIIVEVIDGEYPNQRTFFELPVPPAVPIGGFVWNDYNVNGIQDSGEPGIPAISVGLYTQNGTQVDSVITDTSGFYSFGIFLTGEYYVDFTLPSGYRFSPEHQGTNDAKDSDVNPLTGRTDVSTYDPDETHMNINAGMYRLNEEGNPVSAPLPMNHAPTADGTAGEPYRGTVGEELRFNGSRSYDTDGAIVSWQWSFGDNINASGPVVTHIYTAVGVYPVSLTVTDDVGVIDTYHTTAYIRLPNQVPLRPSFYGPKVGSRNISYVFSMVATDPDNDEVQYVILWGDGSENTTTFSSNGQSIQVAHRWDVLGFYPVIIYAIDPSNATSEETTFVMSIDVQYVGSLGYLIDTDGEGPFDLFYCNQTGKTIPISLLESGDYLIDINGTEYEYNTASGSLQSPSKPLGLDTRYLMLVIGMAIVIILVVTLAFVGKRMKGKAK